MKKDDKASISLIKILGISLVLIFMTSIGVMASNASLKSVKIILSNDYEMTVSITVNHIFVAGSDLAKFYKKAQYYLDNVEKLFK